jgi:hypothetical protein
MEGVPGFAILPHQTEPFNFAISTLFSTSDLRVIEEFLGFD